MAVARPVHAPALEHGVAIAYEDDALLIVEKPSGMVVHPAFRHPDGTLWNLLVDLFAARGLAQRPHLLHRLDRDTSGLLCVPKRPDVHRDLERSMRAGRFTKAYLALVHGWPPQYGTIDAPLARDPANRLFVRVRLDGRPARTHYRVLRRLPGFALLRVRLETGRTHQIRSHLEAIGHPVAGDPLYGPSPSAAPRLFLHAHRLVFPHPNRRRIIRCHSLLPQDLRLLLCRLADQAGARDTAESVILNSDLLEPHRSACPYGAYYQSDGTRAPALACGAGH